jgi:hypothetical protein
MAPYVAKTPDSGSRHPPDDGLVELRLWVIGGHLQGRILAHGDSENESEMGNGNVSSITVQIAGVGIVVHRYNSLLLVRHSSEYESPNHFRHLRGAAIPQDFSQ